MISLAPLGPGDFAEVAHIRVIPGQERFAGTVREAFARREAGVRLHVIRADGVAVGMFRIDERYAQRMPFVPPGDLGLRAFLLDRAAQGKGIAQRAVAALPAHVAARYPAAHRLWLTVNIANPAAVRAYLKGGFVDTGEIWPPPGASHPRHVAGPQHIMSLDLG